MGEGGAERPRLFVTRRLPEAVEARLAKRFSVTFNPEDEPRSRDALEAAIRGHDAILPTITDRFDSALLTTPGRRARVLANFGAGVEHIDLAAASGAGIAVANTPDALTDATADIAILLMLMASRRAGEGERELRTGRWTGWRPTHLMGQALGGRTLGLVGYGRIARATGRRAEVFGMRVLHHSRKPSGEPGYAPSLETLAAEADILSLHTPGGVETRHLVDAGLIGRMKPTAILINTARGPVVDEAALAAAVREGRIAAAGLDVYEREPSVHPDLVACENAVLLPHLGSATVETRTAMGMQAADNLEAFFDGRNLPNRVA
ncbi:D-glycerate dehydrogenase [Sphingomonas sp. CGMCC 1.13654]|uniref:D-glycerate dehydrogenase n=1 Tax=Sphingomonas chungangi TaxID=2683589 RepID=A0A838LBK9_9SPHN|nr:D-glycerate dehydrogenase [Sphingomonas chungangi]MBA2936252.1 D-glycerate dehydrogenase [Sphingomonas chungangi]MVW55637.1 D-glycerate dehydrogenase [Sphingomonas chungangi]